ncbi:MAG: hypothetical protein MI739_14315 [Bacteroidales bacterium]|nr:hypothetical protein [Bacteroidales bacterium]
MKKLIFLASFLCVFVSTYAQEKNDPLFSESTYAGLKFRNIGPALMSGRIADIAIHPQNDNVWYVAVGSGGVWKTNNSGTTWSPIFDSQSSYSIGCVCIDSKNPHVVWVGTGENVGGRHVGYGDGIYKSADDGITWTNMGLKETQHISKIIVHPENSDIVWVAAQGPLWSKGGERGIYMTTDGGKTWEQTLGDDQWVGATDIIIDPRNSNCLYAATWQRHRNVAAYMGGGSGSAIYKSNDGGKVWEKLTNGLPKQSMGKIGLAISPQNPDVIYAAIELDKRTGGVYKSNNRGLLWKKQSDAVAGATGPHYYQELYACPHNFDRLYLADARMQVSDDGGKTFKRMNEKWKHSDNHAIAFRKDDPNYVLLGTDGGMYESFDCTKNWKYISNLPITQFYKVAVDDDKPFYNIYGGTQDNCTQGGPSRTDNLNGIRNSDWEIILFADGHQPATEPGNPDIVYAEWQEGNLIRYDRTTGERVFIKPEPRENEPYERFNWDAPILISPHSPTRLYYASQRIWKSENRGDSWEPISGDLTKNQNRFSLEIMDKTWGYDEPWDVDAMSNYNTITSLAESPVQEGLIYAGTDDGSIQVTEDAGTSWTKIDVSDLPQVPKTAFVNDIKADLFDANTVYVVLDNHKYGDLNPYVVKSMDKGKTWKSITGNIPKRTIVWRIVQDHVNPQLMFVGTEFGIYFTINGGVNWTKLKGNLPTISFRDLAIQRRENDLIGASFGRSFFVLDDYSPLRDISKNQLQQEATLFKPRKALWYIPRTPLGESGKAFLGESLFLAENPPFGAVFTYYLSEGYKTLKQQRIEKEKKLKKENKKITFPSWTELEKESVQEKPKVWLVVKDLEGKIVRKIDAPTSKGFHRVSWDLKSAATKTINPELDGGFFRYGFLSKPGTYTVSLSKQIDGVVTDLTDPVEFNVELIREGILKTGSVDKAFKFWEKLSETYKVLVAMNVSAEKAYKRIETLQKAMAYTDAESNDLTSKVYELKQEAQRLGFEVFGSRARRTIGEKNNPTLVSRFFVAMGSTYTSYGPTKTQEENLNIVNKQIAEIKPKLQNIINNRIPELEKELSKLGGPWISGQKLP